MAKYTLLEMTQKVLSKIDGDEVNSISDTIEATQIANLIQDCYFDIVDEHDLPYNNDLFYLDGLADTDKPSHMQVPESVSHIEWIKYNTKVDAGDPDAYTSITYLNPETFVQYLDTRDSTDDAIQVVTHGTNIFLNIRNDVAPSFWTSFDDEYIVFDAFNSDVDSTLQSSKSKCFGATRPEFELEDDSVPDLPENLFGYLISKAVSTAYADYKQEVNQKAEQRERRYRIRAQRSKWREGRILNDDVNFGRK